MEVLDLICEDTVEGIFSGIYDAYEVKKKEGIKSHDDIRLSVNIPTTFRLFTEYRHLTCSPEKASKVVNTVQNACGEYMLKQLLLALATEDDEKANAVYHTIVLAFANKDPNVMERLSDDHVRKVFELGRYTGNEICHMKGFLRFQELKRGILYSKIGPRNDITGFLAEHFSDRLPGENFVIYDENRHQYALHQRYQQWFMVLDQDLEEENLTFADNEIACQQLFSYFCKKIAITSRQNTKLQRNLLPLRFRDYMVEFSKQTV